MNLLRAIRFSLPAALAIAMAVPAIAQAGVVTRDVAKSPAAVRDYWTKAKMRHAEPVPVEPGAQSGPTGGAGGESGAPAYVPPVPPQAGPSPELRRGTTAETAAKGIGSASLVGDPSAPRVRAHGKVFFTVRGGSLPGNYACSGTAVTSRNMSVVWTAGHCVYDTLDGGGKSVNFMFVPAYDEGEEPFGSWPATKLATTKQWKRDGNLRFDMGAAVVARNGGKRLQQVVGARGIGFDQPRRQTYRLFGYPVMDRFEGSKSEYRCASPNRGADVPGGVGPKTIRVSCDMTGGSSGGGWIAHGYLLSNTSYGYGTTPYLYGPYLSQTAKKLYKRMGRKRRAG